MNGITIYDNEDFFELLDSVRATAKAHQGTFTADEMTDALLAQADPTKEGNDLINSRRVRSTLATLSSHLGGFEITEKPSGVYEYSR
jgi:hypothetical protein